jgi:hypothetical protein
MFVILLVCHRLQQQTQFQHLGNKFLYIYKPATCLKFLLECNVLHIIFNFNVYLLLGPTNKFILSFSTFINLTIVSSVNIFRNLFFFFLDQQHLLDWRNYAWICGTSIGSILFPSLNVLVYAHASVGVFTRTTLFPSPPSQISSSTINQFVNQ